MHTMKFKFLDMDMIAYGTYYPGIPSITNAEPDFCHEGEAPDFDVEQVTLPSGEDVTWLFESSLCTKLGEVIYDTAISYDWRNDYGYPEPCDDDYDIEE